MVGFLLKETVSLLRSALVPCMKVTSSIYNIFQNDSDYVPYRTIQKYQIYNITDVRRVMKLASYLKVRMKTSVVERKGTVTIHSFQFIFWGGV